MLYENITESLKEQAPVDIIKESFSEESIKQLEESFIADEVSRLDPDKIQEFCQEGGVGDQLVAEGKISRRTLVRLNKQDDLTRRTKISALILAKEHNDPLYAKLVKVRAMKQDLVAKIMAKYQHKGAKIAKQGQMDFIHGKKSALPKNFQKFGGEDRVGDQQA